MIDKETLNLKIDFNDEIYQASCVTKNGEILLKENADV